MDTNTLAPTVNAAILSSSAQPGNRNPNTATATTSSNS